MAAIGWILGMSYRGASRYLSVFRVQSRQFPPSQWGQMGNEWTPVDKLRSLILRLAGNWARFRVFDWQPDVPWTNNPTEQVIGKMKMRARTVRGYKNWSGMASGLMTAGVGVA